MIVLPLYDTGSDDLAKMLKVQSAAATMPEVANGILQGEFVNGSRLEADYVGTSRLIHQMFIYGNPLRAYLLAVVVPSRGAAPSNVVARSPTSKALSRWSCAWL